MTFTNKELIFSILLSVVLIHSLPVRAVGPEEHAQSRNSLKKRHTRKVIISSSSSEDESEHNLPADDTLNEIPNLKTLAIENQRSPRLTTFEQLLEHHNKKAEMKKKEAQSEPDPLLDISFSSSLQQTSPITSIVIHNDSAPIVDNGDSNSIEVFARSPLFLSTAVQTFSPAHEERHSPYYMSPVEGSMLSPADAAVFREHLAVEISPGIEAFGEPSANTQEHFEGLQFQEPSLFRHDENPVSKWRTADRQLFYEYQLPITDHLSGAFGLLGHEGFTRRNMVEYLLFNADDLEARRLMAVEIYSAMLRSELPQKMQENKRVKRWLRRLKEHANNKSKLDSIHQEILKNITENKDFYNYYVRHYIGKHLNELIYEENQEGGSLDVLAYLLQTELSIWQIKGGLIERVHYYAPPFVTARRVDLLHTIADTSLRGMPGYQNVLNHFNLLGSNDDLVLEEDFDAGGSSSESEIEEEFCPLNDHAEKYTKQEALENDIETSFIDHEQSEEDEEKVGNQNNEIATKEETDLKELSTEKRLPKNQKHEQYMERIRYVATLINGLPEISNQEIMVELATKFKREYSPSTVNTYKNVARTSGLIASYEYTEITPERAKVIALVGEGKTRDEIAKSVERVPNTINAHLKMALKAKQISKEQFDQCHKCHKTRRTKHDEMQRAIEETVRLSIAGKSCEEIAEILGKGKSTIEGYRAAARWDDKFTKEQEEYIFNGRARKKSRVKPVARDRKKIANNIGIEKDAEKSVVTLGSSSEDEVAEVTEIDEEDGTEKKADTAAKKSKPREKQQEYREELITFIAKLIRKTPHMKSKEVQKELLRQYGRQLNSDTIALYKQYAMYQGLIEDDADVAKMRSHVVALVQKDKRIDEIFREIKEDTKIIRYLLKGALRKKQISQEQFDVCNIPLDGGETQKAIDLTIKLSKDRKSVKEIVSILDKEHGIACSERRIRRYRTAARKDGKFSKEEQKAIFKMGVPGETRAKIVKLIIKKRLTIKEIMEKLEIFSRSNVDDHIKKAIELTELTQKQVDAIKIKKYPKGSAIPKPSGVKAKQNDINSDGKKRKAPEISHEKSAKRRKTSTNAERSRASKEDALTFEQDLEATEFFIKGYDFKEIAQKVGSEERVVKDHLKKKSKDGKISEEHLQEVSKNRKKRAENAKAKKTQPKTIGIKRKETKDKAGPAKKSKKRHETSKRKEKQKPNSKRKTGSANKNTSTRHLSEEKKQSLRDKIISLYNDKNKNWSQREIADECSVNKSFVANTINNYLITNKLAPKEAPVPKPPTKMTTDILKEIIEVMKKDEGRNISELSRRRGIAVNTIYEYVSPDGQLREKGRKFLEEQKATLQDVDKSI